MTLCQAATKSATNLFIRIAAAIDFGKRPQFGVRAEDEVGARVAVHLTSPLSRSRPSNSSSSSEVAFHCGRHVEQVDEEVVGELSRHGR